MSNINELKPINSLNPFARFCCTIGNLPSSYMASLTYEEQLLWFCDYLKNTVIPAVNNNAEVVKELQELYVKLKNYVDNYFENLDVQNEINNKLDEMAEDGTLQNIIGEFLKLNSLITFNNVENMKNSNNLIDGSFAQTLGFYNINDGGKSIYKIRKITNNDIVDNMSIIALNNENLVAELIFNTEINIKQLGAYDDGITDNKIIIDKAISLLKDGGILIFPKGNYLTSGEHIIDQNGEFTIKGSGKKTTNIIYNGENYCFWARNMNNHLIIPVEFKDFTCSTSLTTDTMIFFKLSDRWGYKITNILSYSSGTFCEFYNNIAWTEGAIIKNCDIRNSLKCFTCNRNINVASATDSFFNIKIINCSANINKAYGNFIYLNTLQNEEFPITAYQWQVNATIWFGSTGGGKQIIRVGNYNTLTGIFDIIQDGTAGIVNGSDMNTILVSDNGFFDGKGQIRYQQGNNPSSNITFSQILKQITNWQYTKFRQPLVHLEGAKILIGGTKESGTEPQVIYTSGYLPTFSAFRIKIAEEGNNGATIAESILTTKNFNINITNNIISGSERLLNIRPINNGTPRWLSTK